MLQQNLKVFPSGAADPAAYYFPCFSWRSLYWDFAVWLPQRAKMVQLNPILDHWCMQSFRALLCRLNVISLLGRCVWDGAWYMFPLENQCRVKYNTSCILASLWINVHSVKKINWINTINSPQRCRISLVFSPHHLQMYSLCFQKINICLCTVLREAGVWNARVFSLCVWIMCKAGGCGSSEMINNSDLIWIQTICFCDDETGTRCGASKESVFSQNQVRQMS